MATSSSPTVVVQPDGAAGLRGTPARTVRAVVSDGAVRVVGRGSRGQAQAPVRLRIQFAARVRLQVPAGGPLQAPAPLRIQIPAAGPPQAPAPLRIQIPAGEPLQAPARLRLLPAVPQPAGTLIPLPGAAQVRPGRQVAARVMTPRAVRVRVRPGQVRVRLRPPANGRLRVLPGNATPGPLRTIVPGPRSAALVPAAPPRLRIVARNETTVPAAPARLRIVARDGTTVPAQRVIPAGPPGQARLRIQVPARARILKALPAPANQ